MTDAGIIGLEDFVPALSPQFKAPKHLRPVTDLIERVASGEEVRAVVSAPPRRGKTELFLHAIPWLLLQRPELQIAYASYAQALSAKKSGRARELSRRAGVPLADDSHSKTDWRTNGGQGGVWATSVGGPITGEGFDLILLDDLIKGRAAAESSLIRERTMEWLRSDVMTRLEPNGSALLFMARWHPDDPAGQLIRDGWEHVNLQAITPEGESLWPERWPLASVLRLRDELGGPDGYEWRALYMGTPTGRGDQVFKDVHYYDELPDLTKARIVIGLDFAYSAKTSADWSVAVVLARIGDVHYVLDVLRLHIEPRQFRDRVRLLSATYGNAPVAAYTAATEQGAIEFFKESGIPVRGMPARVDKFSRALPTVAAWNQGKILVPSEAPWLDAFVSELASFTGVKDRHDDQIDSLSAAFDQLRGGHVDYAQVAAINARINGNDLGLNEPPLPHRDRSGVGRWRGMGRGFG